MRRKRRNNRNKPINNPVRSDADVVEVRRGIPVAFVVNVEWFIIVIGTNDFCIDNQ